MNHLDLSLVISPEGALAGVLLIGLGAAYDRALAAIAKRPAREQNILYLITSPIGIGASVLVTTPFVGVGAVLLVFAALGLASIAVVFGVMSRFLSDRHHDHSHDKLPVLSERVNLDA